MKGFNSLLGSHYDHYYLNYDYFSIDDIAPETFKLVESKYLIINFASYFNLVKISTLLYDFNLIPYYWSTKICITITKQFMFD